MKSSALALLLLGTASATPEDHPHLFKRDLTAIQAVLSSVSNNLASLSSAASAFTTDPTALNKAAASLADTLSKGAGIVSATGEIPVSDAIQLQPAAVQLTAAAQAVTDALAAKKSAIEAIAACGTVRQQSETISTNSKALVDAVVGKVPEGVRDAASTIVSGFTAPLAENAANFAVGNCTDAAGGAPVAAPSAAPAATPTSADSCPAVSAAPSGSSAPLSYVPPPPVVHTYKSASTPSGEVSSAAASAATTATGTHAGASGPSLVTATTRATGNGVAGVATPTASVPAGAVGQTVPVGLGLVLAAVVLCVGMAGLL